MIMIGMMILITLQWDMCIGRSHDFASADVSSNFGKDFGLKYYKTGADSAKQQAKSVFERFKEYQSQGGKDSLEEFLSKRGLNDIDTILNLSLIHI